MDIAPTDCTDAQGVTISFGCTMRRWIVQIATIWMAGIYLFFYFISFVVLTHFLQRRYDAAGVPKQEVFYFELLPRLKQMYKDKEWQLAISYPDERPRRFYSRSDVFDGRVYKRLRRGAGRCKDFISFGYCADAIQVDKRMSRNVLPGILRY